MKYSVTFTCGHTETKVLFGKCSERERRIAWWEENCVCTECYKAEKRRETTSKKKALKNEESKNIMKRAWEIYRTLVGDHTAKLALALRTAWAEAKATVKKAFEGFAKVAKVSYATDDCEYISFKSWSKNGKKRIYLNDYKRRTIGYIDQNNNNQLVIMDRQGNTQEAIDYAVNQFNVGFAY